MSTEERDMKDEREKVAAYLKLRDEMLGTPEADDEERRQSAADIADLLRSAPTGQPAVEKDERVVAWKWEIANAIIGGMLTAWTPQVATYEPAEGEGTRNVQPLVPLSLLQEAERERDKLEISRSAWEDSARINLARAEAAEAALAEAREALTVAEVAREYWWPDRRPQDFGERQLSAALIRVFGAATREACTHCAAEVDEDGSDMREGCDECPSQAAVDAFLREAQTELDDYSRRVSALKEPSNG